MVRTVHAEIASSLRRMSEMSCQMHETAIVSREVISQALLIMEQADERTGGALIHERK